MFESSGGSNFMYNVMQNGIGGVNAGGVENDIIPGRGQELAVNDSKAYQYLTRSKEHIEVYLADGFIKKAPRIAYEPKAYERKAYVLTELGRRKFSGSSVVKTWHYEVTKQKEEKKRLRKIKKLAKLADKDKK